MKKIFFLTIIFLLFSTAYASGEFGNTQNDEDYQLSGGYLQSGETIQNLKNKSKYANETVTFKGKVVTAGTKYEEKLEYATDTVPYQDVRVKIDQDDYSNIILVKYQLVNYSNPKLPQDELKVGDLVYVTVVFDENGDINYSYIEYISNERFLIAMVIVYAGAIILIGGFKGFRALIGLIVTILAMFFILVPLIFAGYPPLPVTILTCTL